MTAEERRAGILDAALAVFSARGFHSSSIDDIAREAGISKALIYEHFESKQGLYADLLERNANELFERLASALAGVGVESGAHASPPGSTRSSASSRSAAMPGGSSSATWSTRRPRPSSAAWWSRSPPWSPL